MILLCSQPSSRREYLFLLSLSGSDFLRRSTISCASFLGPWYFPSQPVVLCFQGCRCASVVQTLGRWFPSGSLLPPDGCSRVTSPLRGLGTVRAGEGLYALGWRILQVGRCHTVQRVGLQQLRLCVVADLQCKRIDIQTHVLQCSHEFTCSRHPFYTSPIFKHNEFEWRLPHSAGPEAMTQLYRLCGFSCLRRHTEILGDGFIL